MQNNDFIDDGLFEGIYKDIDRVSQQTQAMLEARGVMRNSPDWNKAFDGLSDKVKVSHINLNDNTVEGLESRALKAFSVQYHPEASPGPHDSRYLFKRFFDLVVGAGA